MIGVKGYKKGIAVIPILVVVGLVVLSVVAVQNLSSITGHAVSEGRKAIYNQGFLGVGDVRYMDESTILGGRLHVQQGDEEVGLLLGRNESLQSTGPSVRFSDNYNSYVDIILKDTNTFWPFLSFVFSGSPALAGLERFRLARDYIVMGDTSLRNQSLFGATVTIGQLGIAGLSIVRPSGVSGASLQFVNNPSDRNYAYTIGLNNKTAFEDTVLGFYHGYSTVESQTIARKMGIGLKDVKIGNSGWIPNVYFSLDKKAGAPPVADCDSEAEAGRMIFDSSSDRIYVCGANGWGSISPDFAAA